MYNTVSMIIASHLSDVSDFLSDAAAINARQRINFAKYLLFKYSDTTTLINPDLEWDEFIMKSLERAAKQLQAFKVNDRILK